MSNYSTLYHLKGLIESLSEDGDYEKLMVIVKTMIPSFEEDDRNEIMDTVYRFGPTSPNSAIVSFSTDREIMTEVGALDVFSKVLSNGYDFVRPEVIEMAINNIGSESLSAISRLVRYDYSSEGSANRAKNSAFRSELICRIVNKAIENKITTFNTFDMLHGHQKNNHYDGGISNLSVIKIKKIFEMIGVKKKTSFLDELENTLGEYGCDAKLSSEDIPIINGSSIVNPEVLIASTKSHYKDIVVPVFIKEEIDPYDEFGASSFVSERVSSSDPGFLKAQVGYKKSGTRVMFSTKAIGNYYLNAVADKCLTIGASVPIGYKLCMVKPSIIDGYDFVKIDEDKLERAHLIYSTLWISESIDYRSQGHFADESPTIQDLIRYLENNPGELKSFISSERVSNGFAVKMANKTIELGDDIKNDTASFIDIVKTLIWIKVNLNAQPDYGTIAINTIDEINEMYEAGFKFNRSFKVRSQLTGALSEKMTVGDYIKLVDMGAICSIKDMPESAREALEMASRRRSQPAHAALLRRYDADEIISMCKKPSDYSAAYEAFPERSAELFLKIRPKDKRALISMDLEI